jgi:hypothetical protein
VFPSDHLAGGSDGRRNEFLGCVTFGQVSACADTTQGSLAQSADYAKVSRSTGANDEDIIRRKGRGMRREYP